MKLPPGVTKPKKPNQLGFITPALISFIVVLAILVVAVFEVIQTNLYIVGDNIQDQKAFNIAEAGANYYLWHLSHNPTDYKDGGSTPATPNPTLGYGPYVHNYIDSNAVDEGTYTLWINPAANGSTITTVTSIGQVSGSPAKRTIQVQIGAPSVASYAVVSNSALWFGTNESADGPVESNQGVRMDGPNDSDVTSANSTYTPSYSNGGCSGSNCSEPGVWGCTTDSAPPSCTKITQKTDWEFPAPAIDGPGTPLPQGAHEQCDQRGVQPRRQTHRLRQLGQDAEGVGRRARARSSSPSRGTRAGDQRGVQPRRQTHRLRQRGQDGEGVGRREGPGDSSPSRDTPARSPAWRTAPTANASSPAVVDLIGKRGSFRES